MDNPSSLPFDWQGQQERQLVAATNIDRDILEEKESTEMIFSSWNIFLLTNILILNQ